MQSGKTRDAAKPPPTLSRKRKRLFDDFPESITRFEDGPASYLFRAKRDARAKVSLSDAANTHTNTPKWGGSLNTLGDSHTPA